MRVREAERLRITGLEPLLVAETDPVRLADRLRLRDRLLLGDLDTVIDLITHNPYRRGASTSYSTLEQRMLDSPQSTG